MLKFIIPAIIIFLIVLFWEKIMKKFIKNLMIKINYIADNCYLYFRNNFYFIIFLIYE